MFSSNSSQVSDDKLFVEDCFSCFLYTGNETNRTITNGIDLAGKGGLVWIKDRTPSYSHSLCDTVRGNQSYLNTSTTDAAATPITTRVTSFNSDGFSLGSAAFTNPNSAPTVSWTFREAPKFFDVQTWTGNGAAGRTIPHNLGVAPGCIIIKATSGDYGTRGWAVWHRGINLTSTNNMLYLNTTAAQTTEALLNNTLPTATEFTLSADGFVNGPVLSVPTTYVAYLFAHDTTSDGIIQCGSYASLGTSGSPVVDLGWEPQWVLIKNATSAGTYSNWMVFDDMRGMTVAQDTPLAADLSQAENSTNTGISDYLNPTATGFIVDPLKQGINSVNRGGGDNYIYIAIRRGPMRTPTTGTSVFSPTAYTANNTDNRLINTGIVTDMVMARTSNNVSNGSFYAADRLRGIASLATALTVSENTDADSFMTPTVGYGNAFSAMNGFGVGNDLTRQLNYGSVAAEIAYAFKRAPSFFDEVCYSGTGSARTVSHNLGVTPELMLVKVRNTTSSWYVYNNTIGSANALALNTDLASFSSAASWNNTAPTASVFTVNTENAVNGSGNTYVAYLFASCPGVSKVGSYTGNGSSQTINCGFSGGARFVMIKRTDSTGNWLVGDTARGLVAGNDPLVYMNSDVAEITTLDWLDTDSSGFVVNQDTTANANVNGATYIYLAVA